MEQLSYYGNLYGMTDNAIIKLLCTSLKQMRLNQNISQEELAKKTGINRITISRMETGKAINLLTLIQLFRALNKLDLLRNLIEMPEISPILLMEAQQKMRKKATPTPKTI
jgi:transcriptional regulator with XRE-family HTH domain